MSLRHASFASLIDPKARLVYCLEDLRVFADDREYIAKRAFAAGSRLLDTSVGFLRALARRAAPPNTVEESLRRREEIGGSYNFVGPLNPSEFGFVYLARVRECPSVIKIGFSTNPFLRMKSLERQTGAAHVLISSVEGSHFDETRNFLARCKSHISNEWFWDFSHPFAGMPEFLRGNFGDAKWETAYNARRGLSGIYLEACGLSYHEPVAAEMREDAP